VGTTEKMKRNFRCGFLRTNSAIFFLVPFFVLALQSSTAAASSTSGGVTTLRDLIHNACVTVAAQSNNAAVAASYCGASITAQTYQFYQLSDGNYRIYTLSGTTYCLAYSGNTVVSTTCASVPSQEWSVQVVSNGMMIEATGGTSCLADPADWNSSATTMQACNGATNEVFQNSIISGAAAACGSTPSGSTVWVNTSTGSSSTAATTQQCPYGGTVTTTWTNQTQELCTDGTLTSTGQMQEVNVVTAAPVCNAASGPNSAVGNITVLPASQPSQIAPPGATINIGTNFTAVSPLSTAYRLTIYLTDSSGYTITSVTDTLDEYDSTVPTTQWQGLINITRSFTVPSVANGTYQVMVALDNAATNQVLAISTGRGVTQDTQYRYAIGTVTVQASAPTPSLLAPHTLDLTGFTLTFDDEFQTLDLSDGHVNNGSKWYTHNEQCCMQTTDGSGTYMYGMDDPVDPYSMEPGGGLDIRLQERNNNWSSGVITSVDNYGVGFSQEYGYFEMSAQFPSGRDTWPAFWLLNTASKASGAAQGEIDVVEYIANSAFINTIRTTLHDWSNNTAPDFSWNQVTNPSDGNRHTYGMLWTAQSMTFYFDGTVYFSCPTPTIMHQPYYMLVDLGIGSGYPTNNTPPVNDMIVQYVRAYALPPGH
jgi:Glycosyl hydrolases family 16/Ricin-type beta-trefoil lectin domain